MKKLQGHRAVVTGASSGIGKGYAHQLAALGCNLVIVARRLELLKELAAELENKYQVQVEYFDLDLTKVGAAKQLFEKSTANGRDVTILISNAGNGKYGSFMDFPLAEHMSTLTLNSVTPTELTYFYLEHMLKHGKKSYISHVSSIAAFQPTGFFTVYSGSKGYLRYFLETLAFEVRNSNVSISCICPGGTYTEFFKHSGQTIKSSGHRFMMSSDVVVNKAIQAMLHGKVVYVPGFLNKIACFLPRILPRRLGLHLACMTMGQAVEKPSSSKKVTLPQQSSLGH